MNFLPKAIYIISTDLKLTRSYLNDLTAVSWGYLVTHVQSATEALEAFPRLHPAAILLDESAASPPAKKYPGGNGSNLWANLAPSVALLADSAPVIVVGPPELRNELESLSTACATDFVARAGNYIAVAAQLLERRLREADHFIVPSQRWFGDDGDNFGEVLRHEVNNPLTGILGNAELLLSEVGPRNDGRLPETARQRLETIAALAIRLRETVRRLSSQLQNRSNHIQST